MLARSSQHDPTHGPDPPSAQLEYLRQYWPRHSEILDIYSTLCCEHILGIFFEPNCFEENEEIWAVVTLAGRCHRNLNGKHANDAANAANLCNLCHTWCVTMMWLGRRRVRRLRPMCGVHVSITRVCDFYRRHYPGLQGLWRKDRSRHATSSRRSS